MGFELSMRDLPPSLLLSEQNYFHRCMDPLGFPTVSDRHVQSVICTIRQDSLNLHT